MNSNLHLLDDIAMMTDTVITAIIPMMTKTPPPTPAAIRRLVSGVWVPILTIIRIVRQNY